MFDFSIEIKPHQKTLPLPSIPNDGSRLIAMKESPRVNHLADLTLHLGDLAFARDCMDEIFRLHSPSEPSSTVTRALWRSGLVHLIKCFGRSNSRTGLNAIKVFKFESPGALEWFGYLKNLRNKHIVHDENSMSQAVPFGVLGPPNSVPKVSSVSCLGTEAETVDLNSCQSLKRLADAAHEWTTIEYWRVSELLREELEALSFEELSQTPSPIFRIPQLEDVATVRRPRERPRGRSVKRH